MKRLFQLHTSLYPAMQPTDAVKLCYQRVLGCGHLLPELAVCAQRIESERQAIAPDERAKAAVPLGGGLCRLDLRAPEVYTLPASLIAKMMALTAKRVTGTKSDLQKALGELRALCQEGLLPFSLSELDAYLIPYEQQGCPVVSHSQGYRDAYQPAYRVVDARYAALLPLIGALSQADRPCLLVIDGMCASGKSTAAALLAELFDAGVYHMDDYFLPPAMRTDARLNQPGGNVHYERFRSEVLDGLISRRPFAYQPYSCQTGKLGAATGVPHDITIIEGAYSLHPYFDESYERLKPMTAFFAVSPSVQSARILRRNGAEMLRRFTEKWIPLEKSYFEAYHVRERAERTILTEDEME